MPKSLVADKKKNLIILRRSKESRVLRGIGIAAYTVLLIFLVSAFVNRWDSEIRINLLLWTLFLLPGFFVCIREVFRRIILLESYLSYTSWYGIPKVRSYNEISDIETVVINENGWGWEPETYVKVIFNDGKSLKVNKGLMGVAEFRKLLQQRAGRKLFKSSRRKKKPTTDRKPRVGDQL